MEFVYRNAKGDVSTHRLKDGWAESGKYLQGFCLVDGGFRTFLKHRVLEYLAGSSERLSDPHPPAPPPPTKSKEARAEILFTGFPSAQRAALEEVAGRSGMKVVKTVTNGLTYLCCGPNAGPTKVSSARERGLYILSDASFQALLETGELPDHE